MLYPLTGQVYVDRELVDFIKISQRSKEIDVPNGSSEVYIKIGRWKTNIIKLNPAEDGSITLSVDSKIQNGFFIFTIFDYASATNIDMCLHEFILWKILYYII